MVGLAYMNLGALEYTMKMFDQSKINLINSMNNFKVSVNENHIWAGLSFFWYAKILIEEQESAEAETYIKKALKIYEKNYDSDHVNITSAKAELGIALLLQKKYSETENLLVGGFEKIKKLKGEKNFNTVRILNYVIKYFEEIRNKEKYAYYKNLLPDTKK
jgi:tetratricopeptide (TPR) repeat protein